MTHKVEPVAKIIGARFRSARALVPNLNRKLFCERHAINRYTMQSWENGLYVSKGKNVEKFIDALAKEGIACTADWLIDGIGEPARPFDQENFSDLEEEVEEEIIDFNALFSLRIRDQAMAPQFRKGDEVFGADISHDPKRAHQKLVIVKLSEKRQVLRKALFYKDTLILIASDPSIPTFNLALPALIYEIVWHRVRQ